MSTPLASSGASGPPPDPAPGSSGVGSSVRGNPPMLHRASKTDQQEAALRAELSAGILVPGKTSAARHVGIPGSMTPNTVSLSVPRTSHVKQAATLPTDPISTAPPTPIPTSFVSAPIQRGFKSNSGKLGGGGPAGVVPALKGPGQTRLAKSASKRGSPGVPTIGTALKGTPARTIRYSLPVRIDKPVRTSKVTGKHVVLPSESQLAPLPESDASSEEEEEDEAAQPDISRSLRGSISPILDFPGEARQLQKAQQVSAESLSQRSALQGQRRPAKHARAPPKTPRASGPAYHTFERMAPSNRVGTPLPRLTSYAIGAALHLPTLIGFLRREHGVKPRLYDDCAYVQYFKPLLPGFGKANIRSAPEPRSGSPGAESRIERELMEREESGYVGSYFANQSEEEGEMDNHGFIIGGEGQIGNGTNERAVDRADELFNQHGMTTNNEKRFYTSETEESDAEKPNTPSNENPIQVLGSDQEDISSQGTNDYSVKEPVLVDRPTAVPRLVEETAHSRVNSLQRRTANEKQGSADRSRSRRASPRRNMASHNHDTSANYLTTRSILEALQVGELVILPYGVVVMFNFSVAEERQMLQDITSTGCVRGMLSGDDIEIEAFHFCYDPEIPAPRIFNDFFTFRTSNHLLKLSLAHAIAQSTKLSVFEESMQRTLELTSHIPRELASTGGLQLKRREALRLTGRLFKLRVDVNLTSNVLDTPELFWSEASLQALYTAIREYLEIDQRVENLNERLAVANDLLDIIHEHISNEAMSKITLIIIVLILVACVVACGEISARLFLHARQASRGGASTSSPFVA